MDIQYRGVVIEKAASNAGDFDARFVMSAATPDRVNDTIDPVVYQTIAGKTSKVIALWNHNPGQPVGYWSNLEARALDLTGYVKFASTSLGLMLKTLLDDDVPLGASIAFIGKGHENKKGGIHFVEMELLECSIVSVAAHPKARQIAKKFGIDLQSSQVLVLPPVAMSCRYAEAKRLAHLALERSKSLCHSGEHDDPRRTHQKGANGTHHP